MKFKKVIFVISCFLINGIYAPESRTQAIKQTASYLGQKLATPFKAVGKLFEKSTWSDPVTGKEQRTMNLTRHVTTAKNAIKSAYYDVTQKSKYTGYGKTYSDTKSNSLRNKISQVKDEKKQNEYIKKLEGIVGNEEGYNKVTGDGILKFKQLTKEIDKEIKINPSTNENIQETFLKETNIDDALSNRNSRDSVISLDQEKVALPLNLQVFAPAEPSWMKDDEKSFQELHQLYKRKEGFSRVVDPDLKAAENNNRVMNVSMIEEGLKSLLQRIPLEPSLNLKAPNRQSNVMKSDPLLNQIKKMSENISELKNKENLTQSDMQLVAKAQRFLDESTGSISSGTIKVSSSDPDVQALIKNFNNSSNKSSVSAQTLLSNKNPVNKLDLTKFTPFTTPTQQSFNSPAHSYTRIVNSIQPVRADQAAGNVLRSLVKSYTN